MVEVEVDQEEVVEEDREVEVEEEEELVVIAELGLVEWKIGADMEEEFMSVHPSVSELTEGIIVDFAMGIDMEEDTIMVMEAEVGYLQPYSSLYS